MTDTKISSDKLHKKDVFESVDYNKFGYYSFNRGFTTHGKKLAAAISLNNRLYDFPIKCRIEPDGKLYIIDGQGRHYAAKLLKVPIFYELVTETTEAWKLIIEYNSNTTTFKLVDYIESGASQGNTNYKTLSGYLKQFKYVDPTFLYSFVGTTSATIKSGNLKLPPICDKRLRILTCINEITEAMRVECKDLGVSKRLSVINKAVHIKLLELESDISPAKVEILKKNAVSSCRGRRKTEYEKYFGLKVFNS